MHPSQPLHLHGSLGRDTATGRGVLYATREFLRKVLYTKVQDCSFVIQVGFWGVCGLGFGALGQCGFWARGVGGVTQWAGQRHNCTRCKGGGGAYSTHLLTLLTHSLTHSLARSLTHPLLTHSRARSLARSLTHSQGFGKVGGGAARHLHEAGGKVRGGGAQGVHLGVDGWESTRGWSK